MINGSFVYGFDNDAPSVFSRTVEWAVEQGIETATFHILTPYPGTVLYDRMMKQGRILTRDWDLYDTRHAVYQSVRMTQEVLETGYWQSYKDFYTWKSIFKGAMVKDDWTGRLRHLAYAGAWKKLEPMWDLVIKLQRVYNMRPLLERVLAGRTQSQTEVLEALESAGAESVA
jgi:radical SAM superfamily enzyme YgiQ (UPF0313 family)